MRAFARCTMYRLAGSSRPAAIALLLLSAGCDAPEVAPAQEEAADIDAVELTAEQIQADYAEGRYTAVQLTRAFLERIESHEALYNAFISMNPDALATAAALDREYAASGPRGPLHGVPVVIKDNIDYGGLVTTAGYDGFSAATGGVDMVPDDDAAVVTRLREAGAIILGKTNLPDFAGHGTRTESSVAGVTLNPVRRDPHPRRVKRRHRPRQSTRASRCWGSGARPGDPSRTRRRRRRWSG